ncbi:NnrUfamily protein [Candidatus Filomicrobium marinum]|uniref:NnrUfamily protein n=2 Tax=Filomicrobium TaxID=119044 RepID=A0A0D6JAJ2_9HYPH|nr:MULTISPECIES: NnrU family protein [Filomicrobium]MCV0368867.1 NnrU family protein [Filomicrobium sp.]CFW97583.1 NnrUfamily protein [Candidatus Filomicrobium marinum]CPR14709.1 NnrUfamily protein [Candidatus Filomicrobium marinum]SDO76726.1 Uncharacterized membrane protein [Filomicrobium insigne]
MMLLIAGLALFFAIHLVPTNRPLRDGLAVRFGEMGYKGVFSIVALIGFVMIVLGFAKMQAMLGSKNPILWYPPTWTRHVAFTLMLPAMILLVAAYIPSRIRAAVKHPMLVAIKIWALAHLLANGDVASIVLFGSFLAYAVYDRISLKHRGNMGAGGANAPVINDVLVVVLGLGLYAAMLFWGHAWLIGVPLVGGAGGT